MMISISEETERILQEELRGIPLEVYLKDKKMHKDLEERISKRLDELEKEISREYGVI